MKQKITAQLELKKGDLLIFLCIGILIIVSTIAFYRTPGDAKFIRIYVDGEVFGTYTLSQPYDKNIKVRIRKNDYCHLKIQDETVYIVDTSCPNRDCVRVGTIRDAGDTLICLPHKLLIRLEGGEALDAISY